MGKPFKIHIRSNTRPNRTACHRAVWYDTKVTDDIDLITCIPCRDSVVASTCDYEKAEFGKGVEIIESENDTLTYKVAALKSYIVSLEARILSAESYIDKVIDLPDHNPTFRLIQNTIAPYRETYKKDRVHA